MVASRAAWLLVPLAVACTPKGPDLAARMTSARMMAESFGFVAYGPSMGGPLAEGKDTRLPLALKAGCYQVLVFAGDGVRGVDVAALAADGMPLGTASQQQGFAAARFCLKEESTSTLIVKSTGGSGAFVAQTYQAATSQNATSSEVATSNSGTECTGSDCEEPMDPSMSGGDDCSSGAELTVGNLTHASTLRQSNSIHWSCAASDGPGIVYRLHVEGRHRLVVDLSAKFDAVVGLFRAPNEGYLCDQSLELECSDDAEGLVQRSHFEALVDTGDYGLAIGGYDGDRGDFDLRTHFEDAPSLDPICAASRPLTAAAPVTDSVPSTGSNFRGSCASTDGDELLYRVDLAARSRLRINGKGAGSDLALYLRSQCDNAGSELACSSRWFTDGVSLSGLFDPGNYTLFADTSEPGRGGSLEVRMEQAPPDGSGNVEGDRCADARPLPSGSFVADTFHAKADLKLSCAQDAASDVVYKFDIKNKARVQLGASDDEAHHVLALHKGCGLPKAELACDAAGGRGIDAQLDPGTYALVVKGKNPEDFGRLKLTSRVRELAPTIAACKAAPKLVAGKTITDTTQGQADRFASRDCGGSALTHNSGDRVYQFTLKERSHVILSLNSGTFYSAFLSLRSDCSDPLKGELRCTQTYNKTLERDLDPGTYYVVVDGYGGKAEGQFILDFAQKAIK